MKTRIITMLLLLITPTLAFSKWIEDNSSHCKLNVNNQVTNITWNGKCVNGKADGYGIATYRNNNAISKYTGAMKAGIANGQGTYILPNGIIYKGLFKNGKLNGLGIKSSSNGFYTGNFINNEMADGYSRFTFFNGQTQQLLTVNGYTSVVGTNNIPVSSTKSSSSRSAYSYADIAAQEAKVSAIAADNLRAQKEKTCNGYNQRYSDNVGGSGCYTPY